ncbi:GPI14 (YJR013W) [Zygosaccharomyces parabailii]|nr:GPI14 (YJR013W) [Zygosaccharomyces parabailii]CDH09388.1 related to GPI mannosyltransferase 1 [Zygosaccharomyces bailii ISA1307]SJM85165.1 related to GPI mannosyltransferase 1 [Zygosaccharomyces bailii]
MRSGHVWLLAIALLLRATFFVYGIYQDTHCQVKYTDIDYFVFHDAAGYVYKGWIYGHEGSPFLRDTYRYTPLLSWLLVPNHYFGWIHFGKLLFVIFDLITGVIIMKLVHSSLWLPGLWLLNPMVITISTRGNSESILSCLVMLTLYWLRTNDLMLAGLAYGLSIHFKIYPIIYCLPITIYVYNRYKNQNWFAKLSMLGLSTLISLAGCSLLMHHIYGLEYLENAYFYHLYRTDHRHNFSLWNVLLYFDSASLSRSQLAKIAFLPQFIVTLAIPVLQWWQPDFQNLLNVFFVQTFAFVTFNKVCTSQYFVWYLIFLPFYIAHTKLSWRRGLLMLAIWGGTQGLWLLQGYRLEFLGKNVFYPDLLLSSAAFFLGNVWLLGQFIGDINRRNIKGIGFTKKDC